MKLRFFLSMLLIVLMSFFKVGEASSYDLPKIKVDKPKTVSEKEKLIKSDWQNLKLFEQKIKIILEENPTLPASATERIATDENLIFVAFYKGYSYFLDKYSIKVLKNSEKERSWKQRIFSIGEEISGKNSRSTLQRFYFDEKNIYNAEKRKNNLNSLTDSEDKKFLEECFRVGYYYAFNEEVEPQKFSK